MADEWDLVAAWRSGDHAAGDNLVALYFGRISRFFRGKVGTEADDLIQQTFLACVEGRDRISGSFRSYLFGVARRRLFEHLRRAYNAVKADFSVTSIADLGTAPSEGVARNQRSQLLRNALRQIPADAQITLELAYWEGLSGAEIAVVLAVEPGTVRSRLARARSRLKAVVVGLGGDANNLFGSGDA